MKHKATSSLLVSLLTGAAISDAGAQAVWNQTGDPIDLPWDDVANWDTGVFPNAPGAVANFTDPAGFVDPGALVTLGQDITIGELNFEDFVSNGTDEVGQSDLLLRSAAGITLTFDRGDDTMPAINYLGSWNDSDVIRLAQSNNLIIAGDDGLEINTGGLIRLDGPNTYTGQTIVTALDTGPDRSGDGRVRVENVTGLGATGLGNETIFIGNGLADGYGVNNRLEPSLRFGGNELLDGPVAEDFIFRYTPAESGVGVFANRTWEDSIFVEDDNMVRLSGTVTLQRQLEANPPTQDVRWDFQCGDTGTAAGDENREFLQVDLVVLDDQSGGASNGDLKHNLELNAVNRPTDPLDPTTGSQIVIGSILAATPGSNRDFGIVANGDGTVRVIGECEYEGDTRVNKGTLSIEHPSVLEMTQNVRVGSGGTSGGNDLDGNMVPIPKDELRFLIGAPGTYQIRNAGTTPPNGDIILDDVTGNAADEDTGDEVPYVIGSGTAGVVRLEFDDITYNGDGWQNADMKPMLDALNAQVHLTAPDGGQLTIAGRIEAPNATDADPLTPPTGTVDVTKIGAGTVILSANSQQPEDHQYNGDTEVAEGTLIIDRPVVSDGTVLVNEETTLGGSSVIGSGLANVVLEGSLDPGSRATDGSDASLVGELTILGSMDMGAGEGLFFDLGAPGTGDRVIVSGLLTNGGVVVIRDAGGLATGTYVLFDASAHIGVLPMVASGSSAPGFTYTLVDAGNGDIAVEVVSTGGVVDSDSDGLPDSFENANGLDPNDPSDAGLDQDGDGTNNLFEYVFGTAPGDPASRFTLDAPSVGAPNASVTYGPIFTGVTYVTEMSTDLETWTPIDTLVAGADAVSNTVSAAAVPGAQFRIVGSR